MSTKIEGGNGNKPSHKVALQIFVGGGDDRSTEIAVADHLSGQVYITLNVPHSTVTHIDPTGVLDKKSFRAYRDLIAHCFAAILESMSSTLDSK